MTRRLLVTYLTLTALALAALALPLGTISARRERDRLYVDIDHDAVVVASLVEDALEQEQTPEIDAALAAYRASTDGRILVVDQDGIRVADSDDPDAELRDYSTRPEIARALAGLRAEGSRHSATLDGDLVYVAIPVASGGAVHGAVRITFPTAARDARVRRVWVQLAALSAVVLAAVAVVGFALARSVTRPLRILEGTAERIAAGDLTARAAVDRGPPEVRSLATTFNQSASRLDQLVGAQRRFVADAAHQLRTPLAALRLRLENLLADATPGQAVALGAAVAEVQRLGRLVSGLLVLARHDASQPGAETIDLAPVADDRLDAWADIAAGHDVDLARNLPKHAWTRAPAGALEQILDNLLDNALTASPPRSEITVAVTASPGSVSLHVVDQGPGLTAAGREHAFERFWRGDGGEGSGLGLAIVRELARSAGGDAHLDPGPDGHGIDAVVKLPASPPPPAATTGSGTGDRTLTRR